MSRVQAIFIVMLLVCLSSSQTLAQMPVQPGHTGLWYDPDNPGHGIYLHVISPYQASASWNVFQTDGQPLWLIGDGQVESGQIEFAAYQVAGGRFPPNFDDLPPDLEPWGRFTITFDSCLTALFEWERESDQSFGQIRLERLSHAAGNVCVERAGEWVTGKISTAPVRLSERARGHSGVISHGELIVASMDGLWRRSFIADDDWRRSGLEGVEVLFVQAETAAGGRLFAGGIPGYGNQRPFFWSEDGGLTWQNAETAPAGAGNDAYDHFYEVAVHPLNESILFASLTGGGLAWSTDGGRNWNRADGAEAPLLGYHCHITFLDDQPDRLYRGCENPLDFITLVYFPLDLSADQPLGQPVFLARTGDPERPDLSNRRPNMLGNSASRPGTLYAGLEGALVAINQRHELERVFWAEGQEGADLPYLYIHAFWINSRDPSHLVLGGGINGENAILGLYETHDHGRKLMRLPEQTESLTDPAVDTILALDEQGNDFLVVVADHDQGREVQPLMRVFRYRRGH
jgi:hypothetical protein